MVPATIPTSAIPPDGFNSLDPPASTKQLVTRTLATIRLGFRPLVGVQLIGLTAILPVGVGAYFMSDTAKAYAQWDGHQLAFLVWIFAGTFLFFFIAFAIVVKSRLVTIIGAERIFAGEAPTISQLWRLSSGSLRRSIPAVLLRFLVAWLLFCLPFFVLFMFLEGITGGPVPGFELEPSEELLLSGALLLMPVLFFAYPFFTIRWIYFGQAVTIEKTGLLKSLRRSWRLTAGNFMRTFGRLLLGQLLVSLFLLGILAVWLRSWLAIRVWLVSPDSFPGLAVATGPAASFTSFSLYSSLALALFMLISYEMLLISFAMTFLPVYTTAMYRDQCYRSSLQEQGIDPNRLLIMQRVASQLPYPPPASPPPLHVAGQQPPPLDR